MKTQEIKRGEFNAYYLISDLKVAEVNRDLFLKHAENFKTKLQDFGWMMPIVISKNGDVIEGHHRLKTAQLLKQLTVPVYIVDWIDTNDTNEHLDCIINLNNGNRAWIKLDYLKAFAKENSDYKIVYDAYLSNSNNISVGNVINCFFGKSVNDKFKKGLCKIEDLQFSLVLLNKFSDLISKYGSNKIKFELRWQAIIQIVLLAKVAKSLTLLLCFRCNRINNLCNCRTACILFNFNT